MSVVSATIVLSTKVGIKQQKWKGSKMTATYKIGDVFTTLKSKVTGTIEEIVPNASGSVRVRLNVNGQPRWTTYKA
jgi:hypothetical protein